MRKSLLVLAIAVSCGTAGASEVDQLTQDQVIQNQRDVFRDRRPRGYLPPPPPRYYEPAPAPRARLGDICVIEDSRSGRSCDLRRPAPLGSFCECIGQSGRPREGRVSR